MPGAACPTCERLRGHPPDGVVAVQGVKGAYRDPVTQGETYWIWRCPMCGIEGCSGCAQAHACTRTYPRCFAHNLPMIHGNCWCCNAPVTGMVCPACLGRACQACFVAGCRPDVPRCVDAPAPPTGDDGDCSVTSALHLGPRVLYDPRVKGPCP